VKKARELRMYGGQGLSVSAGKTHTVINTMGRVYTCGGNDHDEQDENEDEDEQDEDDELKANRAHLGHDDSVDVLVPRLVQALVGVNVVGTAAGEHHTVVWTDEGKAYSFGLGGCSQLGHGGNENELVPRLIEGVLVGKRVVGVATGDQHTVVWTDEGKAYSFGHGGYVKLGHGGHESERVPRLIEGVLAGKRVAGVTAMGNHTVVWTDEGKAYSFGLGLCGQLGHGDVGHGHKLVPRLIEGVPAACAAGEGGVNDGA